MEPVAVAEILAVAVAEHKVVAEQGQVMALLARRAQAEMVAIRLVLVLGLLAVAAVAVTTAVAAVAVVAHLAVLGLAAEVLVLLTAHTQLIPLPILALVLPPVIHLMLLVVHRVTALHLITQVSQEKYILRKNKNGPIPITNKR
jgi:hypothetical protein